MGFCVILKIFTHPPCFLAFSENEIKTVLVVCFGLSGSTSLSDLLIKKSVESVCTMLVPVTGRVSFLLHLELTLIAHAPLL